VQPAEESGWREFLPDAGAEVLGVDHRLEDASHQGRAHAVAGDVAYEEEIAVRRQEHDVVVVAPAIERGHGPVAAPELDALGPGETGLEYRFLHLAGPLELLLHRLEVARVLAPDLAVIEGLLQLGDQVVGIPGLEHVAENPGPHRLDDLFGLRVASQEYGDDVGILFPHGRQEVGALHLGHLQVGHDDHGVPAALREDLEADSPRDRREDLELALRGPIMQLALERIEDVLLVVDQYDAARVRGHRGLLSPYSHMAGNRRIASVPS